MQTNQPVNLGVVGLGRAFMLMLPTFLLDDRIRLAGAADPSKEKREAFAAQYDAPGVDNIDVLCSDPAIEAIYIATPHESHCELVMQALRAGKHVLVEKPMTIKTADARAIVNAVDNGTKKVIVGPSHSFDAPIAKTRKLLADNRFGPVGMIHAHYFTDFVFRPRRPEEFDSNQGGGAVYNQGAHHADIVLALAGAPARSVYARVANLDSRRSCDGAYSALIEFENDCFASITYSGYAHYDSDEEMDWISELGVQKDPSAYGAARKRLPEINEALERANRGLNQAGVSGEIPSYNEHFGNILVSCQKADLRPTPTGIHVYADEAREFIPLTVPHIPRACVIDELVQLVRHDVSPFHSARWGQQTVDLVDGIYASARQSRKIELSN
jgi:phthalate 4,5-cis-dihydrodiol dehydrogenase